MPLLVTSSIQQRRLSCLSHIAFHLESIASFVFRVRFASFEDFAGGATTLEQKSKMYSESNRTNQNNKKIRLNLWQNNSNECAIEQSLCSTSQCPSRYRTKTCDRIRLVDRQRHFDMLLLFRRSIRDDKVCSRHPAISGIARPASSTRISLDDSDRRLRHTALVRLAIRYCGCNFSCQIGSCKSKTDLEATYRDHDLDTCDCLGRRDGFCHILGLALIFNAYHLSSRTLIPFRLAAFIMAR